jgi:hypothetical protein
VTAPGFLDAVVLHFELDLGPTTMLNGDPSVVDDDWHWGAYCWCPKQPHTVSVGETFASTYRYVDGLGALELKPA